MSDKNTAGKRSRWVTMLLGLAVAGLASAALAGRLGRCWWVADLLAHFAVYYTLAGAGLCIVAALFRRWVSSGLALSVLLIHGVMIWPVFAPVATTAPGGSAVLRLAQVNVLHKNRDRGRVVGFIRNCEADIVFVQEVDPWWDGVLREMDTPYRVAVSRPGRGSFGIAMLVREDADGEVELEGTRVLDFAAETDGAQRPAIEASLLLGGRRVMLLTVHPPPPVSAELTALRDSILSRAKDWANEQTDPHIVIGDLNTTPWSYAFSILTGDGQLLSTLNGRGNQGSWPANLPMPWLLPIDHCLLSRGLVCRDRRVGPDIGSDHLPLTVSISLTSVDEYPADRSIPSYPDAPDSPHQNFTEFNTSNFFIKNTLYHVFSLRHTAPCPYSESHKGGALPHWRVGRTPPPGEHLLGRVVVNGTGNKEGSRKSARYLFRGYLGGDVSAVCRRGHDRLIPIITTRSIGAIGRGRVHHAQPDDA